MPCVPIRCLSRVGHQNWYDSLNSGVQAVSPFFFFFFASSTRRQHSSDMSDTPTMKKRKKRKENHKLKVETHILSSQPPLPLTSAHYRCHLSLAEARSGRSVSSIDVDAVPIPSNISLSLLVWTKGPTVLFSSLSLFFFSYILVNGFAVTYKL